MPIRALFSWGRDPADRFCWLQIGTLVLYADPVALGVTSAA